ncbi:MAG TPA: hypothetical protein VNU93_03355, partial [Verrucomicrobiae bacterium]|nr:hypothetical protein [Verrucomicrobiae bacterium]
MALIRLVLDKHKILRREFSELFTVTEGFYLAIQNMPTSLLVRSAPFARSSMLIKGPKYDKSIKLARQALHSFKASPAVRLYTAYSPDDKSYFVSG